MRRFRVPSFFAPARVGMAVLVAGMLVVGPFAEQASAQLQKNPVAGVGGGAPLVAVGADFGRVAENAWTNIYTNLTRAAVLALFNAFQTFLGQLAYDAADYIASGGKGQTAVFYNKGIGNYLQDVASDAAGEFIGSLSDASFFRTAGFNLCRPDPRLLLRLQLSLGNFFPGLQGRFTRPRPRCDFKQVIQNYEQFAGTLSNADVLKNIQLSLNTNTSDLGVSLNILNQFNQQLGDKVNLAQLERQEGSGFKAISGLISGNIKTPSQIVAESTKDELIRFPKQSFLQYTGAVLSNAFELGAVQLIAYTGSIFVNTLATKLLRKVFQGGLDTGLPSLSNTANPDTVVSYSKNDARTANLDLKTPNLQKVSEFEVLSEMIGCPTDSRGLWNCTVDQGFVRAVQREDQGGTTIAAAIGSDSLHGSWRLIPASEARQNQEIDCYTKAYCAGNLQKLRLMRFIPSGFEFAANAPENIARCRESRGCVTLGEVVEGFTSCNPLGERDHDHPWCHLIDPNWVLVSLPQQCTLKGFGDQLLSSTLGQRREECQDIQTCLKRNDRGECVGGYGYCVAEKSVYRFGADECLPRFASCRVYQTRTGRTVSYVRQSADYGACTADNVGCLWYATTRDPARGNDGWIGTTTTGARIYFDKTLTACGSADEGCTALRKITVGQSALNLLLNPSFEQLTTETPARLAVWETNQTSVVPPEVAVGSRAWIGQTAADISGVPPKFYEQDISAVGGRAYTLSLYARAKNEGTAQMEARLAQQRPASGGGLEFVPEAEVRATYQSSGCVRTSAGTPAIQEPRAGRSLGSDWQRFQCTFVTARSADHVLVSLDGVNVLVDGMQLEEGEFATDFVDGINPALPATHLRVAPDEFACTGSDTDHPLCQKFARACRQSDAGCQGYTDTVGGTEIPAIVSSNDTCPAACVGYSEYRKAASAFDLIHETDSRFDDPDDSVPSYFIANTAAQCTREAVGCEAFTSVESAAAGGEQQAYFTSTRSCRKPGPDSQTFFTWEGSDTSGFQLRTWSLVRDRATPPGPLIVAKRPADQTIFKEPDTCNEESWRSGSDPDCRQFYDASGNVFYRYYSQTVLSTPLCKDFRLNQTNRNDCEKTDGVFTPATGECVYHVFVPESPLCRAEQVGCRAYQGSGAGNVQGVLTQDFRAGVGTFTGGHRSNESVLVNDFSLRLDVPARGAEKVMVPILTTPTDLLTLSFWAKASAPNTPLQISLSTPAAPGRPDIAVGSVGLNGDWQQFSVGPFHGYPNVSSTTITWSVISRSGAVVMFLDEVHVNRIQDTVYVRRDSWTTPLSCDQTPSGAPQPQAMLGCRSYRTRQNETVNVRAFSRLCRAQAISCTAFVDTRNSAAIGEQAFVRTGNLPSAGGMQVPLATTTTRPADRYLYLLDEPSKHCNADQASCRAFGLPRFSVDRLTVQDFSTAYVKDDITKYDQALCKPSELFCEEFTFSSSKEYFHNPDTHTCEYREEVEGVEGFPAGRYAGWFQIGVAPPKPCYPNLLESGSTFSLARRGDVAYRGWTGLCPGSAGECTELRDANDHSDPQFPSGKPYFFIHNDTLDTTTCAGNVDVGNGCILLRDTVDTSLRFNAAASYARYQTNRSRAVAPLDCDRSPDDPLCRVARNAAASLCMDYGSCIGVQMPNHCIGTLEEFDDARGERLLVSRALSGAPDSWFNASVLGGSLEENYSDDSFCRTDADCNTDVHAMRGGGLYFRLRGRCSLPLSNNDSNVIVKVKMDRDCAQWLGCSSSEVVFDPATNRYRDLCTNVALCDRASATNNDIYCANYVDRSSAKESTPIQQGKFFDIKQYANRTVGLGQKDYAGYAIPNSYLAPDLHQARVAVDGLGADATVSSRWARDYRLVATIPMPPANPISAGIGDCPGPYHSSDCYAHTRRALPNEATILDVRTEVGLRYRSLHLCRAVQTGRIGYFKTNEIGPTRTGNCYLPISIDPSVTAYIDEANTSTVASFDFQLLAEKFGLPNPDADPFLHRAFPSPECRAQPETDAPYPASSVLEWDLTKNPPKSVRRAAGLGQANVCEFGEECSCTYKRADYTGAGVSKFYTPFSQSIPAGICQGGPRDGQSCIPSVIFNPQGSTTVIPGGTGGGGGTVTPRSANQLAAEAANTAQSCGPPEAGGRCIALSKVEEVRGVFGDCLDRDTTRSGVGGNAPCLAWDPSPVLFGDKDPYHYVPTAGYQPPPSTGQYYCTSYARHSTTLRLAPEDFVSSTYAGNLSRIDYDDKFTSDEGTNAASLDGVSTDGSQVAKDCEQADDDQDDDGHAADYEGLRLVSTGHYLENSYTETFFAIDAPTFTKELFNIPPATADIVRSGLSDANIGFIRIAPFSNPNGMGRIACGYQADWVDGLQSVDYNDADSSKSADGAWRQKFFQNYNPIMTRGSEHLVGGDGPHPVSMPCVRFNGIENTWQSCYFKTWEIKYRSENQSQAFSGLILPNGTVAGGSFSDIRRSPVYQRCESDKPYFAIRAVFETNADRGYQRNRSAGDLDGTSHPPDGPWRFVGFWVASCAGGARDVRYMYMNVDVTSADICKEIAEVRSHDSLQDAAFTDRVWKQSGFTVPRVGISYGERFSPYSSIMNTRAVGSDDQVLFQTGREIAGFSPLSPPTFIASGASSYYLPDPFPKDKWAYLSNLFARVYRIYQYQSQPVPVDGDACLDGPFKGRACNPDSPGPDGTGTSDACSLDGVCDTTAISRGDLMSLKLCDAFSGINAGLPCGDDPDICHSGAIKYQDGERTQLLDACVLNDNEWRLNPDGTYDFVETPSTERMTAGEAAKAHLLVPDGRGFIGHDGQPAPAFVCQGGMRNGQDCSSPTSASSTSRECPETFSGVCLGDDGPAISGSTSFDGSFAQMGRCAVLRTDSAGRPASSRGVTPSDRVRISGGEVYDLMPEEYAPCYANYDCSYNEYNYYLARQGGFSQIYSPRSSVHLVHDYGNVESCTDGTSNGSEACLYTTLVDQVGCGGHGDDSGHVGNRIPPGPGTGTFGEMCVLQAWRYGAHCPEHDDWCPIADSTNACGLAHWSSRLAGPAEWSRPLTTIASLGNYRRLQAGNDALTEVLDDGQDAHFFGESDCSSNPPAWRTLVFGRCLPVGASGGQARNFGRCKGGVFDGKVCFNGMRDGTRYSCKLDGSASIAPSGGSPYNYRGTGLTTIHDYETVSNRCGRVSHIRLGDSPDMYRPVEECTINSNQDITNPDDPDHDNNACTHGVGYRPRLDLCPDPSNEFCGLIAYKIHSTLSEVSLDPRNSPFHLPTDVTMGHYTPNYLGSTAPVTPEVAYRYINYYTPVPPRVAAPDIRQCPISGQCAVQRVNTFAFNGQVEGPMTFSGGQQKSTIRFYAWAAHNQMPLRQLVVDWGDGFEQSFSDARMKNHKPFCGVTKECYIPNSLTAPTPGGPTGLTCDTDSDCPPGFGRCEAVGLCDKHPSQFCTKNSDCASAGIPDDTCKVRTMFGNSPEACEPNYFEFSHLYVCKDQNSVGGRVCGAAHCSRDSERICTLGVPSTCAVGDACMAGLAEPGGCWDRDLRACRFTPRVVLQDNWGWCTGECRNTCAGGSDCSSPTPTGHLTDAINNKIIHKYGGCYAGVPLQAGPHSAVRSNIPDDGDSLWDDECNISAHVDQFRPWIVYPGALQLRAGR